METACSFGKLLTLCGKAKDQYVPVCMCLTFPINPQQNKYPFLPESLELYGRLQLLFYFWHQSFRTQHMNHLENNVGMKIQIQNEDSDSVGLEWGL